MLKLIVFNLVKVFHRVDVLLTDPFSWSLGLEQIVDIYLKFLLDVGVDGQIVKENPKGLSCAVVSVSEELDASLVHDLLSHLGMFGSHLNQIVEDIVILHLSNAALFDQVFAEG